MVPPTLEDFETFAKKIFANKGYTKFAKILQNEGKKL